MHNPCTTQGQTVLQRSLPRPYRYLNVLGMMGMLCLSACQKDNNEDEIYPSLITEFADLHTDQNGTGWIFNTDKGKTYVLSNPQKGLKAKAIYRVMCGYVPDPIGRGAYLCRRIYSGECHDAAHRTTVYVQGRPNTSSKHLESRKVSQPELSPQNTRRHTRMGIPHRLHYGIGYRTYVPPFASSSAARRSTLLLHYGICQYLIRGVGKLFCWRQYYVMHLNIQWPPEMGICLLTGYTGNKKAKAKPKQQ